MNNSEIENEVVELDPADKLKLFLRIQNQTIDDLEELFKSGKMLEEDKIKAIEAVNKDTDNYMESFNK